MDKVLASSVPSVSPADLACGAAGYWARLSWRRTPDGQAAAQPQRREGSSPPRNRQERPPRFAPEFDGIDCFETIVFR
ncbi:hypothetical protein ABZP36_012494 [Zizania latifolia]